MKSALVIIPLLLPLHAYAGGSATPAGSPASSALAHATSTARSTSSARVSGRVTSNVTVNTSNAAQSGVGSGDRGSGGGGTIGGISSRVPDVVAGSLGTSNPCGVGGSVGGSGPGAGGLLSWLTESDRCSLREDARLLWQMGEPDSAMQTACNNPWIADGRARAGHPCQRDVERWQRDGYRYTRRSDGVRVWER